MRTLPAALAAPIALAFALACGDTLVDHNGTEFLDQGPACEAPDHLCGDACVREGASSCGDSCTTCTAAPAGAVPICAAHACDFECTGGLLRCGAACCPAVEVAAGPDHTCAITGAGTVKCWGANPSGQLGTGGGPADVALPADVSGIDSGATAVSAGWTHTCAVVSGEVRCWGSNGTGQLGNGSTTPSATPVAVTLPAAAIAVATGELHTCALLAGGAVHCWGANGFGQLGIGAPTAPQLAPGEAVALPGAASAIAGGRTHACAILAAGGALYCWGTDADGQVGDGGPQTNVQATPAAVVTQAGPALANAIDVRAGELHTCAAVTGGTGDEELWCWGANALGQVGFDPERSVHYPAAVRPTVISNPRASQVAAGNGHSCALRSEGSLKCFGSNAFGQLGTASPDLGPPPSADVNVFGTSTSLPSHVAAGGDHTCAILADGTLYCWGSNAHGELGDGTTAPRAPPAPVSGR